MFDVVLVTGAAGTGKTTTAQAWAASRHGVAAHLSHDAVSLFTKSGLVSPGEPTTEAVRQWRVALDICVAAATIYSENQIQCAIDTFLVPANLQLWRGLGHLQVGLVVLHPSLETALARNQTRREQVGWEVPEWHIRGNHAAMRAWQQDGRPLILDTTHLSVPEVVEAINAWERDSTGTSLW